MSPIGTHLPRYIGRLVEAILSSTGYGVTFTCYPGRYLDTISLPLIIELGDVSPVSARCLLVPSTHPGGAGPSTEKPPCQFTSYRAWASYRDPTRAQATLSLTLS